MASDITLDDACLGVANRRLFGLLVGAESADTDTARGWVTKLRESNENAWPGIGLDLAEQFPTAEEKWFWASLYGEVADRIFLRPLGNQEVVTWQSSCIGDAYVIARLLTRSAQHAGPGGAWHPDTPDPSETHHVGRVDLRL